MQSHRLGFAAPVAAGLVSGPAAPFVIAGSAIAAGLEAILELDIGRGRKEADLVTGAMAKFDPLIKAIINGDQRTIPVEQFAKQLADAENYVRSVVVPQLSGDYADVIDTVRWYLDGQTDNPIYRIFNFYFAKNYLRRARDAQNLPAASAPAPSFPSQPAQYPGATYQDDSGTIYYGGGGAAQPLVGNGGGGGWQGVVRDVIGAIKPTPSLIPPVSGSGGPPVASVQAPSDMTPVFVIGGGILLLLVVSSLSNR